MNCPRCKAEIGPLANPDAIVTCPGCGSRLMTRAAALRSQGAGKTVAALPPPGAAQQLPAQPQPTAAAPQSPAAPPPPPSAPSQSPSATQQTAVKVGVRSVASKTASGGGSRSGSRKLQGSASGVTLDTLFAEMQALRETQLQILEALDVMRARPSHAPASSPGPAPAALTSPGVGEDGSHTLSPIRSAARKSVVLVDDDPRTREAATAELERAGIPVRAFTHGNRALSAIAEDKPDVIILELGVGGELAGKDLVNMIKATMEWVDIPIVLWTREAVSNQKEARQIHGADEVVAKGQGEAALVARVITLFRR